MPKEIRDWCSHANACYTCKNFRAGSNNLEHFKSEKVHILKLVQAQAEEKEEFVVAGKTRMADITEARLNKNIEAANNIQAIITGIESDGCFKVSESKFQRVNFIDE